MESGHFSESDFVCLAGYVASDANWDGLCKEWKSLLGKHKAMLSRWPRRNRRHAGSHCRQAPEDERRWPEGNFRGHEEALGGVPCGENREEATRRKEDGIEEGCSVEGRSDERHLSHPLPPQIVPVLPSGLDASDHFRCVERLRQHLPSAQIQSFPKKEFVWREETIKDDAFGIVLTSSRTLLQRSGRQVLFADQNGRHCAALWWRWRMSFQLFSDVVSAFSFRLLCKRRWLRPETHSVRP